MTKEEFDKAVMDAINNFPVEEYSDVIIKNLIKQMFDTRLRGKVGFAVYEKQLMDYLDPSQWNKVIPSNNFEKIQQRVLEKLKNLNYQIKNSDGIINIRLD